MNCDFARPLPGPRKAKRSVLLSAVVCLVGAQQAQAAEDRWLLFSRHGECFDIAQLKRKLRDMPDVRSPEGFVAFLESKGLRYSRQPIQMPRGRAVEVQVPDLGLSPIFFTVENCAAR